MVNRLLAFTWIAVLCTILTLGLWPFHAPGNDVVWLRTQAGVRLGRYSTVISSSSSNIPSPQHHTEASLEIWLQPEWIWDSATFLAFYRPGNLLAFSLYQSQKDLRLETSIQNRSPETARLYVREVFRKSRPVLIAITCSAEGTSVYIDGALVTADRSFPRFAGEISDQLVVGDSPGQSDSWRGQLLGLAIYQRQLTAEQILRSYSAWAQTGRPQLDEDNIALYLFDEHAGNIVHNRAGGGVDLHIPEKYRVMEKIALEPFWTEFSISQKYWVAALKNIVGFIPFGFWLYAYLINLPIKRAALFTVAAGTAVSFTIEILQAFLPTRDSGTTDILTNTLGTWIGVVAYPLLAPSLVRLASRLPFRIAAK